jgi:hypothetical protein
MKHCIFVEFNNLDIISINKHENNTKKNVGFCKLTNVCQ